MSRRLLRSGVLKIRVIKSTKLPAARLAKLQKPPHVQIKLGHMVQKTKPSKVLSESSVEWNQELIFLGGVAPGMGRGGGPWAMGRSRFFSFNSCLHANANDIMEVKKSSTEVALE